MRVVTVVQCESCESCAVRKFNVRVTRVVQWMLRLLRLKVFVLHSLQHALRRFFI